MLQWRRTSGGLVVGRRFCRVSVASCRVRRQLCAPLIPLFAAFSVFFFRCCNGGRDGRSGDDSVCAMRLLELFLSI